MVLTNDGSKDIGEINIGIRISSINATMLIVKFNSASNSLKFKKKLHNMLGTCKCLLNRYILAHKCSMQCISIYEKMSSFRNLIFI